MTPSQLSAQLRHIAAKISNSKFPRRDLVARDLKNLVNRLAVDDQIPNREPDEIIDDDIKNIHGKVWYLNNDPRYTLYEDITGIKEWYFNDKPHREDGPAIISPSGTKRWFLNGKLHREDGPAVEFTHNHERDMWFLNGKEIDINDAQSVESIKDESPELYNLLTVKQTMEN
jgi:hypothetical protein